MSAHIRGTVSAHRCRDSAALAPADTWAAAGTWPEADMAPGGFIHSVLFIAQTQACTLWQKKLNILLVEKKKLYIAYKPVDVKLFHVMHLPDR